MWFWVCACAVCMLFVWGVCCACDVWLFCVCVFASSSLGKLI